MGRPAIAVAIFLAGNILAAFVVSLLFPDIDSNTAGALDLVTGIAAAGGYWYWSDPKRRNDEVPPTPDPD